jgi:TPR repeat protein
MSLSPLGIYAGMSPEEVKIFEEAKAKAEKGDAQAQLMLGWYYLNGDGVALDSKQTEIWWRKSAEQGHEVSINNLGHFYSGLRSRQDTNQTRDLVQAVFWWRKGAELGHPSSLNSLATCYFSGNGVEKDMARAVSLYRKAAEQGHDESQFDLAGRYAKGEGVQKNMEQAVSWYRQSAQQGYGHAQHELADCYASGQGAPKDEVEAYAYYNLAGAKDAGWWSDESRKKLADLEKKLSREEIAAGQKRAREVQKVIDDKKAAEKAAKKAGK